MRDAERVTAGLAVLLKLPDGAPDVQIVREALAHGIAPSTLYAWYATPSLPYPACCLESPQRLKRMSTQRAVNY